MVLIKLKILSFDEPISFIIRIFYFFLQLLLDKSLHRIICLNECLTNNFLVNEQKISITYFLFAS